MRLLFVVVLVSGIYDLLLGGTLLFALDEARRLLGAEEPRFPVNANLNGLFAMAVGAGYFAILKRPWEHRWYLWIMGPFLKGAGAVLFVADFLLRDSPPAFLVFAFSDGALAALTAFALTRRPPGSAALQPVRQPVESPWRRDAAQSAAGEGCGEGSPSPRETVERSAPAIRATILGAKCPASPAATRSPVARREDSHAGHFVHRLSG